MRVHRARRLLVRGAAAAALVALVAWAAPASAHVTITPSTTAAGAFAVLEVSVGHGCDGSPTTEITIRMPPEITSVTPARNALWDVEKEIETLDPPAADAHGNEIDERVASVTYTARTPLPDGYRDTFGLAVQLPEDEGATLVFPTVQTCEEGESAWIEVPADGQDADELELPAPSFVITAAGETAHGTATEEASTEHDDGDDQGDDAGDDAGDDVGAWTIAALVLGVLGVVLGGAALAGQRRRT
ncbi:MAG TPA: YcnI family protein [Nocardioides sp.]|nr:YcnI family protein [Nocardioides sp.]